ncbi:uncharacterized protein LACBIDRAFT_297648 [Laccaria bicolor S238N-H82]|uniref:Predicted protein n=1 Tax=Laccaria bicolor (strain S238N-H82 / ATCC MYA-4686) TaxID=486041 RepID=B0DBP4_LACBS|nr:uncharacterized protein LACBIDRAFT_297648 [Laccaria bicolor S238N-H82]EDR08219.1 predicted protein [Laccaria bicolor S238N-H82]|eukprot:XP_001881289.1 predicted protein [Laccaria bicolor S238N-H82]
MQSPGLETPFDQDISPAPDEPPSTHWDLHLSVTRTHGNRTLPTSSPQWKALRAEVLLRDDRTCSACGYVSPHPNGRSMVIDHADGDASNNDPTNLRIHCPPCEAVRHCGFAGMRGWLVVGESTMEQVDIVRKTRGMFESTGTVPHPKVVDPSAIPGDVDVLELANMMLETPWEDLPPERRRLRGFFTGHSSNLFQKTMLTGNQDTNDSGGDLGKAPVNESDRRAAEIVAVETSLPWIGFSKEFHKSSQKFLDSWPPSKTLNTKVAWICVDNDRAVKMEDEESLDRDGLSTAWDKICAEGPVTLSQIDKLAEEFNVLWGKWLVFVPTDRVDALWGRIVKATLAGTMGCSAKVSPCDEGNPRYRHVICVYNSDYRSKAEVDKLRDGLRRLGVKERIGYKPDIYTYCRIYMGNSWGIPPSRYHS